MTKKTVVNAGTETLRGTDDAPRIPMFLGNHALLSLRDNGFSLFGALGEPIDNSIESRANHIAIHLEEGRTGKKKHIERIVIADDGLGMNRDVLAQYLQIGFSTRFMSTTTIGKYGVGAKLAALSLARRIDIWSRESGADPWLHAYFDIDELVGGGGNMAVYIDPPSAAPMPENVASFAPSGSGTVLVWSKVDRLEEGRRSLDMERLRLDVMSELSRMFRAFLEGGIKISVDGTDLLPYDPLFLMEGSYSDHVLSKHYPAPPDTEGAPDAVRHFPSEIIADENINFDGSVARLRVTVYHPAVMRERFMGGDELAKKLRLPKSEGHISFLRMGREINYAVVPRILPGGVQERDRHMGIELQFTPELDLHFGVRNVKRGVEPDERLRAEIRSRLAKYIPTARKRISAAWTDRERAKTRGEHDSITTALGQVDITLPKGSVKPSAASEEEKARLKEERLRKLAEDIGLKSEEDKAAYVDRVGSLPFILESVDWPGHNLLEIEHTSEQAIVRLNKRHRFYREVWAPMKTIAEAPEDTSDGHVTATARRAIEALTLMVLAYAKAETMHPSPHEQYDGLRDFWGMFLHHMLGKIKDVS